MRTRLLTGALLAATLLPATALAGTLQIRDPGDVLSAQDEAALRASADAWPFDARVVFTTEAPSRAAFDRYVGAQVASANMVVVGVDPAHHLTSVHFGTGTRIARARFRAIEDAGDGWFRQGQWRGGVEAILSSASASVGTGSPTLLPGATAGSEASQPAPSFPWGLMLLGLGGVAIAVMVFRASRRRAEYPAGPGVDPYRAQPYPPGYYPGGPGGYGPGYGPQPGGMGGLGAGILGAGVGGLAGYALGSAMANREEHHVADHGSSYDDGSSGFDAGGSTSGWDGGGGDFGGGGGDFGGGGGDW